MAAHSLPLPVATEPKGSRFSRFIQILRGVMDEITDQRAYRTHLAAHGAEHSAKEWRRFCDAHYKAKGKRGTCC